MVQHCQFCVPKCQHISLLGVTSTLYSGILHINFDTENMRDRIYSNRSDIDAGFASTRRRNCPATNPNGNGNLAPLDLVTPNSFDNNYFKNLLQKKRLIQSDQVLFSGGSTDNIVTEYSRNHSTFSSDFASAMIKMGDTEPLTSSAGIIRRLCSAVN
ncbi:lignin-forming anionic peroxidase-like [Durio zibethinus]|uniref:peroxidase n=1 Tax=Durio zibethinus TaxID=66656 RepID=A0A6P5XBJ7_DURZI|nr:lignin-forming anionic peroxidase-like [Durio zibethinus]